MNNKIRTHRVITFLTREELDFLDKLEKDMMFSTGKHISRSKILQDVAELLVRTRMDATGIKTNEEFIQRIQEEIARMSQKQQPKSGSQA